MKKCFLIILLLYTFNILFSQENKAYNNINNDVSNFLSLSKNVNYLNSNGYYFGEVPSFYISYLWSINCGKK